GLNAGLVLRAAAEPAVAASPDMIWTGWALALSALLQVAAGLAYVVGIWPRVKAVGRQSRNKENGGDP
ncbi:MAG: hypothetical protein R3224_07360, partial [Balneolaceae bacterium]|nr:hypothetical protein [Balneolaceae bacterium]